jgi:hypothetical protein
MPRAYVDDAFNWQHAAFAIFKRSVHSGFSHLAPKGEVFGYNRDLKPALTWSAVQQNLRDRA